ncbi:hypothetical protein E3T28_16330 [Cryobacterium sinapicolor]|uniref:Uncharacterized protein n=1 Tax=Cryobacterium sinapicolor TaxID=1259236 RepID=A0ABY2ISV7_9MICO|nr:hypothetical protein E3T28_16330 [Cryobacterium sinapicolor]
MPVVAVTLDRNGHCRCRYCCHCRCRYCCHCRCRYCCRCRAGEPARASARGALTNSTEILLLEG